MTSHIADDGEQIVRYYSFYSNASRGLCQKENKDGLIPCDLEPDENAKPNRNWARLIQKIYEVNPHNLTQLPGIDADYQYYRRPGRDQQDFRAFGFLVIEDSLP